MNNLEWVKFSWDLKKMPVEASEISEKYHVGLALPEDRDAVAKVASTAFALDSGWGRYLHKIQRMLEVNMDATFKDGEADCIVLRHGNRIIGVSLLDPREGSDNNLVSGPCVLVEYLSRGFGSLLLESSLHFLRDQGLKKACGVTRGSGSAAKFVYPKFAGKPTPFILEELETV